MNRLEKAVDYHIKGFNCAQSVLAAFTDVTGLSEEISMNVGGGFGGGAGTGELCGAVSGAIMVLGLLTPVDSEDPVGSKKRTVALSKELQKRFSEKFNALRCRELLQNKKIGEESTLTAKAMGLTNHCDIMIITAVEIVEELLAERG